MRRQWTDPSRPRIEDGRLVTGNGEYVGDIRRRRMVDVAFVRSEVAHGIVRGIDTEAAAAADGVIAIVTAADMTDVAPVPEASAWAGPVNAFPLARDRVRHVGHAVAAVVAADRYRAEDAAELVEVDVDPLPAVVSMEAALAPDAVRLYDGWSDNCCVRVPPREDPEADALFERLRRVRGRYTIQRQAAVPLEPRGVVAEWSGERLTVWSSTQMPHILRGILSRMLGLPEGTIRVVAPDVGGGFGGKAQVYGEEYLVAWLARRLRRPVRWLEDRYEHMVASVHARDMAFDLEAAVDDDGRIQAVRGSIRQDLGSGEAYPAGFPPLFVAAGGLTGPYRIAHQQIRAEAIVTNKTPTGAYRGFGVPEAVFAMERLVDQVAEECGLDPVAVRRNMIIGPEELPYTTATGGRLESGSHRAAFEDAVARGRAARARVLDEVAGDPRLRVGLGFATYVEGTAASALGGTGIWGAHDACDLRFDPDGGVTVSVGVTTSGQGVTTMVATVAAQELGVRVERVRVDIGDTDGAAYGTGCWGSRSTIVATGAIKGAAAILREKGTRIAAHLLECAPADLVVADGAFAVKGSPAATVTWDRVAAVAMAGTFELPDDIDAGLEAHSTYDPPELDHRPRDDGKMSAYVTHNNASHAAVVIVDTETGGVRIAAYVAVQDVGRVINPIILDGQVHGGVVQGIAGALLEDIAYDDQGTPLSTNFMEYRLPGAVESPWMELSTLQTPAPETPLGAKGAGEIGVIGPPAAIAAAVQDALAGLGVPPIVRTPITPQDVLALIDAATTRETT